MRSSDHNTESRRKGGCVRRLLPLVFYFPLPFSCFILPAHAQSVGIGIAIPDNSALLELASTTQGLLIPRMTSTQMLLIASPATGDLAYNTTSNNFYYYNGTIWTAIIGSGWSITGDAGTSASTNFLGTTDSVDLVQKTNSHERMRVYAGGNVGLTNTLNSAEKLIFYEPSGLGTLFTAFKAGAQDSTLHYTLPPSDGMDGQALDDSLGIMGWKTLESVGGGWGDTLWARGSASYELYSLGIGNGKQGKYSIVSTEYCSSSADAASVFGDSSTSSAKYGCVSGGSNNSVAGQGGSVVRGGARNSAGSQNTMIVGGLYNSTSGQNAVILGGDSNSCSGASAVIINGADNSFSSQDNLLFGYNAHPTGGNQLIFYPPIATPIRTGIQNTSPAEAMDVTGNVRFSVALKPNGAAGSAGQLLQSAGSGTPPTWGTIAAPSTSNNWGLTGNSGSSPPTNYIGTTDATAFVMRTNATERARIRANGFVGIGTSSPTHQLDVVSSSTTDETAAVFGVATGSTTSQSVGVWGRADNTSSSNTGSISLLATGNGSTTAGSTNVALQLNQGEFTMGRDTLPAYAGVNVEAVVEGAASGAIYSQHGPSGVIQVQLSDLSATIPAAGVYLDLGDVTINNEYITSTSIILAGVVAKINYSSASPFPTNGIYKVDVESRASGSCVIHIGMFPTVSDTHPFHTQAYIRIGYIVINPGK